MERQLPPLFLYSEDRIALDAAIADRYHGGQASATTDKGRPETGTIKYSVILVTLSAAALLTTHTEWMSIRF